MSALASAPTTAATAGDGTGTEPAPAVATPTPGGPWLPMMARIGAIQQEVTGIITYRIDFDDPAVAASYRFEPGQFNMLYLPGLGEVAISISSDPAEPGRLLHTVRASGGVTSVLARRQVGDAIGVRGPFGTSWPMDLCKGQDVVIACGGVGLAPLRPAIYHIARNRADYGRVFLLYGARTGGDLLYQSEYDAWRDANIEVTTTVDMGDADYHGNIGVVPVLFYRLRLTPARTRVLTCGPEVMLRFVAFEALARKIAPDRIHVSMERNMNCAIGQCGHCQIGSVFVCRDGPVFTYKQLDPFLHVEDF
jgi:NAD(P)H-flavin reductase